MARSNGPTRLFVRSVDAAGNIEKTKVVRVFVSVKDAAGNVGDSPTNTLTVE